MSNIKNLNSSAQNNEQKTNNSCEGYHRHYNTVMTVKKNYKSVYKMIQVIRVIDKATSSKINEIIGGQGRLKKDFEKRNKLQQSMTQDYADGNYRTPQMKLEYLHTVADKCFILDFTTAQDGKN